MIERWKAIDLYLLDGIFQRVADMVMDFCGLNCFWLARFCIVIVAASSMIRFNETGHLSALLSGGSILIVIGAISMAETRQSRNPIFRNEWRQYYGVRFFVAFISLTGIPSDLISIYLASVSREAVVTITWIIDDSFYLSAIYFLSCTPKPRKPFIASYRALQISGA